MTLRAIEEYFDDGSVGLRIEKNDLDGKNDLSHDDEKEDGEEVAEGE